MLQRCWPGLLFLVLLASGMVGYFVYYHRTLEPPVISSAGLEPAVASALEQARAAVRQAPRSADAWGRLGMVLYAHSLAAEAKICFAEAERLDPQEPRWPYHLGTICSVSDLESAVRHWHRAAELAGTSVDAARLHLASSLLAQGLADAALEQYRLLLQTRPDHPVANLGAARALSERGDWSAAAGHLRKCLESPFTRRAAHALLAAALRELGDFAAADEQQRLCETLPADAAWPNRYAREIANLRVDRRGRLLQAEELLDNQQSLQGRAALEQLVRDHPDFDPAWRALGFVLLQQRDYAAAEWALTEASRLAPQAAEAHYYLGCVYLNQGKPALATAAFQKAVELKPDYAAAYLNLGLSLKLQQDVASAMEAFRTAIRCRPTLADAHRELAALLAASNDVSTARDHARQALELNPADSASRELLHRLQGN